MNFSGLVRIFAEENNDYKIIDITYKVNVNHHHHCYYEFFCVCLFEILLVLIKIEPMLQMHIKCATSIGSQSKMATHCSQGVSDLYMIIWHGDDGSDVVVVVVVVVMHLLRSLHAESSFQ